MLLEGDRADQALRCGDQRDRLRILQKEWMRGPVEAALTFPALRAMVQEVSSLPFGADAVKWLPDAQAKPQLRI